MDLSLILRLFQKLLLDLSLLLSYTDAMKHNVSPVFGKWFSMQCLTSWAVVGSVFSELSQAVEVLLTVIAGEDGLVV